MRSGSYIAWIRVGILESWDRGSVKSYEQRFDIVEVTAADNRFGQVLKLAVIVLSQDRYILEQIAHAQESHIIAAFVGGRRVGFLRYQMRLRSPVTSTENYALKIAAGYTIHPSDENDSYYFLRRL